MSITPVTWPLADQLSVAGPRIERAAADRLMREAYWMAGSIAVSSGAATGEAGHPGWRRSGGRCTPVLDGGDPAWASYSGYCPVGGQSRRAASG